MHRTLLMVLGSLALASTLVIGVAAAGARSQNSASTRSHLSPAAVANPHDARTTDPTDGHGTLHYGPFASSSPDSGTCGNDWAQDTFNRVFTVVTNADGTFRVVEDFKDANFVTVAGASPGACETGANTGGTVKAGITGRFQGYFLIAVTGGSLNRSAACTAVTCDTTRHFITTVFGAAATYDVTTFLFNYSSGDKQLIAHHWKNASLDRGGNLGDIRTS